MQKLKIAAVLLTAALGSANAVAATQPVNANVNFVDDVTATVNQAIEFGTLVKTDGVCGLSATAALAGAGCGTGAVAGTPAVGIVQVDGVTDASVQIDIDATNATDTGITFTPNVVDAADTSTALGVSFADVLAGGQVLYHLYGDLNITAATVAAAPTLSVDFAVVYN